MVNIKVNFGSPQAQKEFIELNRVLLTNLDNLKNAFQSFADALAGKENDPLDRSIYYLAYISWEDFNEILLLSANGMENGAKKILRGMFERNVTAHYLHKHPEEADSFWNRFWIDMHKVVRDLDKAFPGIVPSVGLAEIEAKYAELPEEFRKRLSWSKKNMIQMAEDVQMPLHVVKGAYYLSLMETHPTANAVIDRIHTLDKGTTRYDVDGTSLMLAHGLILSMLEILYAHFNIEEMRKYLNNASDDFHKAWQAKAERLS